MEGGRTHTTRGLLERTITHDLFGPGALQEPAELDAPDKYELGECLGRGGCGVVYKAVDRVLGRPVALKFLTETRRADVARFRREARCAARLQHPAIVTVYEFGEHGDTPYIAMQFVDGCNLAQARWSAREVVRAIAEVARALQHAHEAGVIHRDIKPANILVDRAGQVFVTDFGVARDLSAAEGVTLSRAGALLGTPALMAPEQARGENHAVDARTDVYALGATLYTLLTGRHPFERPTLVDLLHAVLHDEPPLPRARNPSVPRALEAVMLRCLRKSRAERFASAAQVAAELEAWLADRPVSGEQGEWFRRLVGAPAAATSATPSDADLFQTRGMEIARELAQWDANLYRVSRNLNRCFPQLDGLLTRLDGLVQDHPQLAWARFYRGMARFRRGHFDGALDDMESSIDRLAQQASAQFELGRLYLTLYLHEHRRAREHFSRVGTRFHLDEVRGRLRQAEVCFAEAERLKQDLQGWQADFARAAAALADLDYARCVAECDRILARDPDVEDVWKLRGDALRFSGQEPFESYRRALEVRRSDWEAWIALAEAHIEREQVAEAQAALESALEIVPDQVGALVRLARLRARSAAAAAAPAEAVRLLEDALGLAERAVAAAPDDYDAHLTRAETLAQLAAHGAARGRLDEALASIERARGLKGCENRLNFVRARLLLQRARSGGDPAARRSDLEEILSTACGPAVEVPDGGPWVTLVAQAREELSKCS